LQLIGKHGWLGNGRGRHGRARPAELACLRNRVNMGHHRPKEYGSQSWTIGDIDARLWPLTGPTTVNHCRAGVGLPFLGAELITNAPDRRPAFPAPITVTLGTNGARQGRQARQRRAARRRDRSRAESAVC
jgi:hypothetical protein